MKKLVKSLVMHRGLEETNALRRHLAAIRRPGWPYCPTDEGDVLFQLARSVPGGRALEVGFATGSTAAYILHGLESGELASIDFDQDHHEREGEKLILSLGLSNRHRLVEEDSIKALPRMYEAGLKFSLVFLDGWKTFDHVWVDTFYCARMLDCGGYIVFDDARMPAVRKCISLLVRYYGFEKIDTYHFVGGLRQRIWHLLSTRSFLRPYVALRKIVEIGESEAGRRFDFWKKF